MQRASKCGILYRGRETTIMRALTFIRGLVRPVVVMAIVFGFVALAIYHGVTVDAKEAALMLGAFGASSMGF